MLGHVLKFVGERYHIAEEGENDVKEWNVSTLWRWARDRIALRPCRGGGLSLMVKSRDEDADASARPHSKVGSQSNKVFSVNFARQAAPVEKAMVKRVEKTKAQMQNIVEGMKIEASTSSRIACKRFKRHSLEVNSRVNKTASRLKKSSPRRRGVSPRLKTSWEGGWTTPPTRRTKTI